MHMSILNRGDVVDGYKVQNLIKKNFYTETYRVEDINSNPFFLKLFILSNIPPRLVMSDSGIVKEIAYSKEIHHRNIINYISHGEFVREDGAYQYYITNYFNGQLLADRIALQGKMSEDEALAIFRKILNAINYLHNLTPALCHNDLDVSNIIISDSDKGEPVIIDLGHISQRSGGYVDFDTADLNPFYHADETKASIFDEQGDVFSVCAILYTMLIGEQPWNTVLSASDTFKERISELSLFRKSNPIDFQSLNLTKKTQYILFKGLQRKSQERFETIQEIINVLDDLKPSNQSDMGQLGTSNNNPHADTENDGSPNQIHVEVKRGGGNGFSDVAGMKELKEQLYRQVIFVIKDKELAEQYRITPPNGILLYGPPGCGKTFFAEKFSEETGFNFILIKSSDLGSSLVHGSQEKIGRLFALAKKHAPVVLCFDEFDALVPNRSSWAGEHQAGEINEFLSQMNNCAKNGIFIIATSNRPDKIDPAILRTGRIDKNIYVPLPDLEARREMFSLYLKNRPLAEGIDTTHLAELTDGYVASDIAYIVNDAAMTAAYARESIAQCHLEAALANSRSSLRKEHLESYEKIREQMEGHNRANNIRTIVNGL